MENYKIYCDLKSSLKVKKQLLSDLKQTSNDKEEIISLEIDIEEELNALNMIFNHLITQNSNHKSVETE